MTDPTTHLNADTLETYFHEGQVVTVRLAAGPVCLLRIDPPHQVLELWTPADGPEPDVTAMSRLTVSTEEVDGGPWLVLAVDARGAHFEAYSLLAAVVDDLRAGRPLHSATARSLATYGELLERRTRLSEEKALGLLGELLLLEHLVGTLGEVSAVEAWLGPRQEEHDFVLDRIDAEIKTTLSERRSHLIGSETQLQPSPARSLWLVSLQLTRAGSAKDSFGLPDTILRVRGRLTTTVSQFDAHLGAQGWREVDAELYPERYMPRSLPAAYLVDDRFPAITRRRLDSVVPQPELVGQVSYRVDVTSLETGTPPGALGGFVKE